MKSSVEQLVKEKSMKASAGGRSPLLSYAHIYGARCHLLGGFSNIQLTLVLSNKVTHTAVQVRKAQVHLGAIHTGRSSIMPPRPPAHCGQRPPQAALTQTEVEPPHEETTE